MELDPTHIVGQPSVIMTLDLNTCSLQDAANIQDTCYKMNVPFDTDVSGFAGWFTVDFRGSRANPVKKPVLLTTGPEGGYTHWGQQVFYLKEPINATAGTQLSGRISMARQEKNKRLYNFNLQVLVNGEEKCNQAYEVP